MKRQNKPELDFFIIGAPNSGTTSLWYILRQHPEIYMPEVKEPRFFNRENYNNDWSWYNSLFKNIKQEKVVGEASINYCETHIWPDIPKRIYEHYSKAKIIFMVRHPIRRLESCWRQALNSGHWYKQYYSKDKMPLDFNKAVMEYPHFLETTKYWTRLNDFREYFSDEQIKVIFLKDFSEHTDKILKELFDFLNVKDRVDFINKKHVNKGANKMMELEFWGRLKELLFNKKIMQYFPQKGFKLIDKLFRKRVPQQIEWKPETKKQVLEELENEVKKILDYSGKNGNYWNLYEK